MDASAPEVAEEEDGGGNDDDDVSGDEDCNNDDDDNDDETQSESDDNVDETPHANSDGAGRHQKVDETIHPSSEGNGAIHAATQPKSLEAVMQLAKQRLKDRSCPLKQAEKKKNQINNHTKRCGYEALFYAI